MTNERPLSIIKLFFRLRFAQSTEMDMVGDWVVLLSKIQNILNGILHITPNNLYRSLWRDSLADVWF